MSVELINVLITVLAVGAILAVVIQKSRLRVSGRLVRFCTLSGAFPTSVEVPASVSDGS